MRKVKYLVAALLLMGATTTFTSCIDNDEPAGITELRGAKAELLKAKAAVELANAAYVDAQTQHELAMVEYQNLVNENQKLSNQLKELTLQEQTARTEAAIAEINAKLEQNKLNWEAERLKAEENLAKAQKAYEDAMAALELSKDYLSDDESAVLDWVETKYNAAKADMLAKRSSLQGAYDDYEDAVTNASNYIDENTLKEDLIVAQANEEKAVNQLNLKKQALDALLADENYIGWQELRADFQNKLDSVAAVIADKQVEEDKLVAYEENHSIKTLKDAIDAVIAIKAGKVADSNPDAFEVSEAIKDYISLATDANAGILEYADGKLTIKNFNQPIVGGYKDKDGKGATTDYEAMLKYNFVFNGGNGYDATVKAIAGAITDVTKAKEGVDPNIPAWAEDGLAVAKKAMEKAKDASDAALDTWKKAVEAYTSDETYAQADYTEDLALLSTYVTIAENELGKADADQNQTTITNAYNNYKAAYNRLNAGLKAAAIANRTKIEAAIKDVNTFKAAIKTSHAYLTSGFSFDPINTFEALESAAKAAFGDAAYDVDGKVYRVMPTDAYVSKNDPDAKGSYTKYLNAVAEYEKAQEKVDLDDQFDAVLEQLNAWSKTLTDAKTAYEKANKAKVDAVTTAQATVKEKVVTPIAALKKDVDEAYQTDIKDMLDAITNNDDVKEFEQLVSDLKAAIGEKKGVDGATASTGLYKKVENAQNAVLAAEKRLQLFEEGNLSEQYIIDNAKEDLELAKAEYASSVETFNYWSSKLQETIEKLYNGEDVTIPETPEETPDETPEETPDETPEETPAE
ncbi:hypothetical protein [Phocaeicola barnesiae]|uniref:hypothetical protein n=1 Tax=Phocaeicola barnesiae TaxID=376804 RepID=UPI0025A3A7E5|nr:hypothetical protein [Phocaeicola barnesiae]MDM8257644.1 hypothetical protein [Phocaeicola barnesiae]